MISFAILASLSVGAIDKCVHTIDQARLQLKASLLASDLERFFPVPKRIDGVVSRLYEGDNLRIYGLSDRTLSKIEMIEVWGFEHFPTRLFDVTMGPSAAEVHYYVNDQRYLRVATQEIPGLFEFLTSKHILSGAPIPHDLLRGHSKWAFGQVERRRAAAEQAGKEDRNWPDVYPEIYKNELKYQLRAELAQLRGDRPPVSPRVYGNDPSDVGELAGVNLGVPLPSSNPAVAVISFRDSAEGLHPTISLNPSKIKFLPDTRFFPSLAERIRLENRFDWRWIGIGQLEVIYVEIAPEPTEESASTIAVLRKVTDLPPGTTYQQLDPLTLTALGTVKTR